VVPRCLTIAGSDSGGGAGIQADLKAFARLGCYGMSAIVALTAQNTLGVSAIHEVPPDFVRAQLAAVFEDIGVDAAKTGMLFSAATIETVASFLESRRTPLVVDPVMLASSGARLLRADAERVLVERLFPLASVVTPNLLEAETDRALVEAGRRLVVVADHTKWGVVGLSSIARLDQANVLITDGHLEPAAREILLAHVGELVEARPPEAAVVSHPSVVAPPPRRRVSPLAPAASAGLAGRG
jgi:hydroxymethylpyrimidine kinase/phosphomethylpyrimidine kinase